MSKRKPLYDERDRGDVVQPQDKRKRHYLLCNSFSGGKCDCPPRRRKPLDRRTLEFCISEVEAWQKTWIPQTHIVLESILWRLRKLAQKGGAK